MKQIPNNVLISQAGHLDSTEAICPTVHPFCACAPMENCRTDMECEHNFKCCKDCCGGHSCLEPVV